MSYFYYQHLLAGAVAGTTGAIVTCPLEVLKTRLQSSVAVLAKDDAAAAGRMRIAGVEVDIGASRQSAAAATSSRSSSIHAVPSIRACLRFIVETEGWRGLFKGLLPNVVGVAPSRGIYFTAYSGTKALLNDYLQEAESPVVHMCSAAAAGFTSSTATNPIWVIKTRLQLDQACEQMSVGRCVRQIRCESGMRGFYRGITASYLGIPETIIHFVIYEGIKGRMLGPHRLAANSERRWLDFVTFTFASACSKAFAATITYPHEVARTRLRQPGRKYRGLFQTLGTVRREEGARGLYRGLGTHLIRQIPNTAITMVVYELVVHLCSRIEIDADSE